MAPDRQPEIIDYEFSVSDQLRLPIEKTGSPNANRIRYRVTQPLPISWTEHYVAGELAGQTTLPGFYHVVVKGIQERADRRFFEEQQAAAEAAEVRPAEPATPASLPGSR